MKLELHWKIIIGLVLGLIFGVLAASQGWGGFTSEWIAPFGKIFINLLKLIAVPLVLSSLITGVASLSDLKKTFTNRRQNNHYLHCNHRHRCYYWTDCCKYFTTG